MNKLDEIEKTLTSLPRQNSRQMQQVPARGDLHLSMSYADFLTQVDEAKQAEWVNGETIIFMPPGRRHQDLVTFLAALLRIFVEHFQLGELLVAPFEMKMSLDGNAREPDLLFVAHEHLDRLTEQRLIGPADLVVEVISPESVYRDRSDKFDEYEAAGIREYWLVDARPGKEQAHFWALSAAGRYQALPVEQDGIVRSLVLTDFWLKVDWLLQEPKPNPLLLFTEIIGLPPAISELFRPRPRTE